MDGFNNPLSDTYLTRTLFIIPSEGGGIRGISVTKTQYQYLNAAFAFIIAGICGFVWQFVVLFALTYYPLEDTPHDEERIITEQEEALKTRKRETNRHIALVMMWNASDPWTAITKLCAHAINACFRVQTRDLRAGSYDVAIMIAAFLVSLGTTAAGLLIPPTFLETGAFAPVNPASVFYATVDYNNLSQIARNQQTLAPAIQRAMGIVEFAKDKLSKNVHIVPEAGNQTGSGGEILGRITYDYNVTGVDLGLQHRNSENFVLTVEGACTLEYGWFNASASNNTADVYNAYGSPVSMTRIDVNKPTGGKIILGDTTVTSNFSYAIIPETVGRMSASIGYDPWYTTVSDAYSGRLVIDNRRPVLSCWEKNTWSYGRYTAKDVEDLDNLPGLNLPPIIGEDILQNRLAYPMIVDVASGLGNSILVSSTTGLDGTVDAATATYTDDFARLILASYVTTQNVLRDTAMITNKYNLQNAALDDFGVPKPGTGDFVLTSGEVQSLSFNTLIAVPVVFVILWIVQVALDNSKPFTIRMLRSASHAAAFQPIQMYKFIDEQVCGYRGDWVNSGRGMPYIKEAFPVQLGDEQKPATGEEKPGVSINEEIEEMAPQAPAANMQHPIFASPRVHSPSGAEERFVFNGPRAPTKSEFVTASETTVEKSTSTTNKQEHEKLGILEGAGGSQ